MFGSNRDHNVQRRYRSLAVFAISMLAAGIAWAQTRPNAPVLLEPAGSAPPPVSSGGLPIPGGSVGQVGATGWQHTGTTLKSCESYVKGADYVLDGRTAALTVDSCDFKGKRVLIYGNVTLRKSRIINSATLDCAEAAVQIASGAGPVLIEDVEIGTTNPGALGGQPRQDRTICISKGNSQLVTLRRLWTHDTMRGLDFTGQNNIRVEDSYLGPNVSPPIGYPPGSCSGNSERQHASAIRAAGGSYNIKLTNTVLHIGYCSWASGLIATYPENGANHDWEVSGGRWIIEGQNDGGYGIAAGYTQGVEQPNYNYNFHDFSISTQAYSSGCPSGCAQNWGELSGTKTWSNVTKYSPGSTSNGSLIAP